MANKKTTAAKPALLRKQAEEIAQGKNAPVTDNPQIKSPEETERLLHELQVHQIELEMQNEELHRTQLDLEESRERYYSLYDLAPVGYLTINEKGLIMEANLKAAILLGVGRGKLVKQLFSRFILKADQDDYYLRCREQIESGGPQSYELRMLKKNGEFFWTLLETVASCEADGKRLIRVTLSDITETKQLEESLLKSRTELQERVIERTSELISTNDFLSNEILARKQAESHLAENVKELHALSRQIILAQETERRAVALELHDEIGQSVTALKMLINQAERLAPEKRQNALKEASIIASELVQKIREMSLKLRPSMLDDLGLFPALVWHFERFSAQTGIKVNFKHSGLPPVLPPEITITVYRVIQEALTNIARYAEAKEAEVNILCEKGQLSIKIEDKGRGFELSEINVKATAGLSGMRERVHLLGGKLVLDTAPRKGTRISVELPVGTPT